MAQFLHTTADVNVVLFEYSPIGRKSGILAANTSRIFKLLQAETISSFAKFYNVSINVLPDDPKNAVGCSPQSLMEDANEHDYSPNRDVRRSTGGLVALWGNIFQKNDTIVVQNYAKIYPSDSGKRITFQLSGAAAESASDLVAEVSTETLAFPPRVFKETEISALEHSMNSEVVLRSKPVETVPGESVLSFVAVPGVYQLNGMEGEWLKVQRLMDAPPRWAKIGKNESGSALRKLMPELEILEIMVGYLRHYTGSDDSDAQRRQNFISLVERYLRKLQRKDEPSFNKQVIASAYAMAGDLYARDAKAGDRNLLEKARAHLEQAVSLLKYDANLLNYKAVLGLYKCCSDKFRRVEADANIDELLAAISLDPGNYSALSNLEVIYHHKENAVLQDVTQLAERLIWQEDAQLLQLWDASVPIKENHFKIELSNQKRIAFFAGTPGRDEMASLGVMGITLGQSASRNANGEVWRKQRADAAVASLEQVVSRRRVIAEENATLETQSDLAIALESLGLAYSQVGRHRDAVSANLESLSIRSSLARVDPAYEIAVSTSLTNLATLHGIAGRYPEAQSFLDEAIARVRRAVERGSAAGQVAFGAILNSLATLNLNVGNYQEAEQAFLSALSIQSQLAANHVGTGKEDEALTLSKLSTLYGSIDRKEDALNVSREALKQWRILEKHEPLERSTAHAVNIAATLNNMGALQSKTSRESDAEVAYGEALAWWSRLSDVSTSTYDENLVHRNMAATLDNLGKLYLNTKRHAEALEVFKQAAKIRSNIREKDTSSASDNLDTMLEVLKRDTTLANELAEKVKKIRTVRKAATSQ